GPPPGWPSRSGRCGRRASSRGRPAGPPRTPRSRLSPARAPGGAGVPPRAPRGPPGVREALAPGPVGVVGRVQAEVLEPGGQVLLVVHVARVLVRVVVAHAAAEPAGGGVGGAEQRARARRRAALRGARTGGHG